jgi:hypothetical protein
MAAFTDDIRHRDARAKKILKEVLGNSAVGLDRAEIRKVFDGWLYWGRNSFAFFADEPILNGSRELALGYDVVKFSKTMYLSYNVELRYENLRPNLVVHSTHNRIRMIEGAIYEYVSGK